MTKRASPAAWHNASLPDWVAHARPVYLACISTQVAQIAESEREMSAILQCYLLPIANFY